MDKVSFTHGYEKLSPRERQVMDLVAQGDGNEAIAERLEISASTVELHRRRSMQKFNKFNGGERFTVPKFIANWWQYTLGGVAPKAGKRG